MGKLELNKQHKERSLLNTAFEFFTTKGFSKTSISDIVGHAGVAKGTFYLYFKDKYDISNKLIARKTADIFNQSVEALRKCPQDCFEDEMIFLIDDVIRQLNHDKILLNFISKNLEWGIFKNAIMEQTEEIGLDVMDYYQDMIARSGKRFRDPELMLFMIVELVGSTIHNVILFKEPVTLEVLKPELVRTIRLIIRDQEMD